MRAGRRSSSLPESSQLLTTQPMSVSSLPVHMVNVPSSNSLPTLVPSPLPVDSHLVTSPTTSPDLSENPVLSSSPIPVPTLKPLRRPHMSTSQSLLSAIPIPQPSSSMLPFQQTTRVDTPLVLSGGCSQEKFSDSEVH